MELYIWKCFAKVTSVIQFAKKSSTRARGQLRFQFSRQHHHLHENFWQQLDQLHGLDNLSDGSGVLTKRLQQCVEAMWYGSVHLERPFPPIESVRLTEWLSKMLFFGVDGIYKFLQEHVFFCIMKQFLRNASAVGLCGARLNWVKFRTFLQSSTAEIKLNGFRLTLARARPISLRGRWYDPPRVSKLRVVELSGKRADFSWRVLTIFVVRFLILG